MGKLCEPENTRFTSLYEIENVFATHSMFMK
ncbi:hypothetical protein CTS44_11746 [Comamonas thiooxydans]|nr:hypothetical protein CTS44_11746 [Comamonas thiooxydans]